MFIRDLQHIDAQLITVAIEDPEFALMCIKTNCRIEEIDVGRVPVDVVVYCKQLEKKGRPQ